jgi:hypothetical protein
MIEQFGLGHHPPGVLMEIGEDVEGPRAEVLHLSSYTQAALGGQDFDTGEPVRHRVAPLPALATVEARSSDAKSGGRADRETPRSADRSLSVTSLLITTEAMVADRPEPRKGAGMPGGGGMGGIGGMDDMM